LAGGGLEHARNRSLVLQVGSYGLSEQTLLGVRNSFIVLNVVLLFAHLELKHLSELPSGFGVSHFHLTHMFAEGNASPLLHIILALFHTERRKHCVLEMFCVLFFFGLKVLLEYIAFVNLVLSLACAFHPFEISDLLD
jgi:hypothetical protein